MMPVPVGYYDAARYDASVYDAAAAPPGSTYLGPLVPIPVPDIDAALVNFDSLELLRAPGPAGPWTVIAVATLEPKRTNYDYRDAGATSAGYWYRWQYLHAPSGLRSQPSPPVAGHTAPLLTAGDIRRRVADALQCLGRPPGGGPLDAPYAATGSTGSATLVACAAFATTRAPQTVWRDWEMYLPTGPAGVAAPESHPVASFAGTATTGLFTLAQAASAPVLPGAPLELYAERAVWWWTERVNDALLDLWREFTYPVAGALNRTEYPLPHFVEDARQVLSLVTQTGRIPNEHLYTEGIPFGVRPGEGGGLTLYLPAGLTENGVAHIQGFRHPDPFTRDSDVLVAPGEQLQLLVWRAARDAAERLRRDARSAGTLQLWQTRFQMVDAQYETWRRRASLWTRTGSPRRGALVASVGQHAQRV